jgi:competence protein ComEC
MVSWNPFVLVYDPGFQLSFLATFGLIFLSPVFEKKLMFVSEKFALREIVSSTFATQVFVFPLLMYKVGYISVVAPLVNILVLPVVPFAMLLGFVVGVFGIISFYFAVPFSFLAHLIFSYIFLVVGFFAKMPFSSVSLPNVKWWHVLFIYFAGMFFIFIKTKRTRKEII